MKINCSIFVIFSLLFGCSIATIAPESRGFDFMVAFGFNLENGYGQTQTLYISSDVANTVVVSTKTSTIATLSVPAKGTVSVDVSTIYLTGENSVQNAGVRVYSPSNTIFTLVGLNTYPATSDAFLAFPVNVLGTSYMAAGYTGCCGVPGYMYVVAPTDGTTVTFNGAGALDGHSAGSVTYSLNSYQGVLVGINGGDITGWTVVSNKPVALFGGAACSDIPTNDYACNVLVDQIPPVNTWDTDFITVPIVTRTAGDILRVISNTAGTVVTVNGNNVATLASGNFYEFSSSVPCVIHTSHPALVMQYDKGSSADGVSADPFQIWIPPVNQYSANYYVTAPTASGWTNYMSIVIASGQQSGLNFDGGAVSATWHPISGSSFVYTSINIAAGNHHIFHNSPIQPFQVIVMGFGYYDGYGYVGGNRLAPLQDPCTPTPTIPADGIDNDCDGKIDEEIRNGIDDDGDGLIDEDLAADTCCYSNTAVPVLTVSGSTASVSISCAASLPAAATVTATVVCGSPSTFTVTPVVSSYSGACTAGAKTTRTWTATDSCGRATTISQTITFTSVCGNGIVESPEQCDGGSCCSSTCNFLSSSTVCRASGGACDVAESCSGSSSSCPADGFLSSSTVCRASAGICDVAESCSGSSALCPANGFQSSSTVCRASAGICDVTESCTGSSASCPADGFQSSSTVCRASVGPCDPSESCSGSSATCPADSNGSFETACPGLSLLGNTAFTYYDVIAFGDFTANTGDIEQRLAVGGNFVAGDGWSVGYQIDTSDAALAYALVVNGNAQFGSGAVYPDGSGIPRQVPAENMFVGGAFTGPSYLGSRVTSCAGNVPGCLSSQFSAAQSCYGGFQSSMASTDNVQHSIQWSGLYVTCNDVTSSTYHMTLTSTEMGEYTWTSLTACNPSANWIITISGTDSVTFNGGSFPANSNQIIWNIPGTGRTINVGWTQVDGSILAPYNNVNQPSGVVIGKVIANNIVSLQINKAQCSPH